MTLEFKVAGQHIAYVNNTANVVADSRNYIKAKFTFSEEWTYPVTVLFKGVCKTVPVLLAQAGEEITVPPEVLKAPLMLVSCYCGDLITADSARVKINPSGYTESPDPSDPEAPSYYSQMIAYIDQINALIGDDAEAKDTLTKLQSVIDKAQTATTLPDQTVIGQMDALIDQYISNEDAVANQIAAATITNLKLSIHTLGEYAFRQQSKLRSVSLPDTEVIERSALQGCTSLMEIHAPKLKIIKDYGLGAEASAQWNPIYTTIRFPECREIYYGVFQGAVRMKVCILDKLEVMGNGAFIWGGSATEYLILPSDTMCISQGNPFSNCDSFKNSGKGHIYVPKILLDDYKNATNWTAYAERFRAIEDYPDAQKLLDEVQP